MSVIAVNLMHVTIRYIYQDYIHHGVSASSKVTFARCYYTILNIYTQLQTYESVYRVREILFLKFMPRGITRSFRNVQII